MMPPIDHLVLAAEAAVALIHLWAAGAAWRKGDADGAVRHLLLAALRVVVLAHGMLDGPPLPGSPPPASPQRGA